ncbi:unnamed protein product [Polarella glacialis]|uniref:Uncharacterized protein n=1 Tax=Polarella glacialis TaxID=89957 RepID=A0A813D9N0_POLGL|nr:unnamed protein product [Polarella glacialis]
MQLAALLQQQQQPEESTTASAALGTVAEARQKVLRLREQVFALSAHCERLESATASFNGSGGSAAVTLGPAHAAAMRAAADQLTSHKGPSKSDGGQVPATARQDPSCDGIERMRSWVAEIAGGAQLGSAVGFAPSPGVLGSPDEGAGPVAGHRSAPRVEASQWAETLRHLWPDAHDKGPASRAVARLSGESPHLVFQPGHTSPSPALGRTVHTSWKSG